MRFVAFAPVLASVILVAVVPLTVPVIATPPFPTPTASVPDTILTDLILTGSDSMFIDDKNLVVRGQIFLADSAQLNVRQSIITIDLVSKRNIKVSGKAIIRADTTIFGETIGPDPANIEAVTGVDFEIGGNAQLYFNQCFALVMSFLGDSHNEIRNSTIMLEPLGVVHVEGNSFTSFDNCAIGAVFLDVRGRPPLTISNLTPGYFSNWSLQNDLSSLLSYELVLTNSTVNENTKGYEGGMEMGWNIGVGSGDTLTISNSRLNKLAIAFPASEHAFVTDLQRRVPVNYIMNEIRLNNTEVQTQWQVNMKGGGGTIYNSDGVWLFMDGGGGNVYVANSHINELDPWGHDGSMTLDNSTWCCGYEIFDSTHFYVEGSVRMMKTVPLIDATSEMTRLYNVQLLHDSSGTAWAGLPLQLVKDSVVVWGGVTNAQGEVAFNITFDGNNFLDDWQLGCPDPLVNLDKSITIKISNPVKVSMELEEDGVHYRSVVHVAPFNPGVPYGTRSSPYTSIEEAIDNSGGDIIRVAPGEYAGYTVPGKTKSKISLQDGVILIGSGAGRTTITDVVVAEEAQNVQVSGFTLQDGIEMLSSTVTLSNNVIAGASGHGVAIALSTAHLINNTIVDNDSCGVFAVINSVVELWNNIIAGNGQVGIEGEPSCSATIDYNDVYGNTIADYVYFSSGANDLSLDPSFVDAGNGNYHLAYGSPCIDAGDPASSYNDVDGSRNDMGAYGGPFSPPTSVGIDDGLIGTPARVVLLQNRPNPFNGVTFIEFFVPRPQIVTLNVYDVAGRRIRTLISEKKEMGWHTVTWEGNDKNGNQVSSGVYWYRLRTDTFSASHRAVYLK